MWFWQHKKEPEHVGAIKFCIDCKHYKNSRCGRILNPVNGEPTSFCSIERDNFIGSCRVKGKYWEAK